MFVMGPVEHAPLGVGKEQMPHPGIGREAASIETHHALIGMGERDPELAALISQLPSFQDDRRDALRVSSGASDTSRAAAWASRVARTNISPSLSPKGRFGIDDCDQLLERPV